MHTVALKLRDLFVAAIPTVVVFLLLHAYLRRVLYRPLQRTLAARRERTEGQFETARRTIALAEEKLTEYEQGLRAARAEMYHAIEGRRKTALDERQRLLAAARDRAEEARRQAEAQLAAEMAEARRQLQDGAEAMAGTILGQVLRASARQPGVGA